MAVKLFNPFVSWHAIWNVIKVLRSGYLAEGKLVKQFEYEFANKFGFHHVCAVNSGTSALELAYDLARIKPGDEVITPVLTCTATNLPLVRRGAKIVFADIDYDLNVDIKDVRKKITKRTRALVFVHFGGNNRGLEEIISLGEEYGIPVIEDAAQAVGSPNWGLADFTCVSLQAIKTLTSGDGGFLICKDKTKHDKAKRLRWFGYDRELKHQLGDTDVTEAGYKFHMNDVTAAIGLGNLRVFDKVMAHRGKIAEIYSRYGIKTNNWLAQCWARDWTTHRARYAKYGIEIGQHHYRNDKYSVFKEFKNDCPNMDILEKQYYFVPFHFGVSEKQAHLIGDVYLTKV